MPFIIIVRKKTTNRYRSGQREKRSSLASETYSRFRVGYTVNIIRKYDAYDITKIRCEKNLMISVAIQRHVARLCCPFHTAASPRAKRAKQWHSILFSDFFLIYQNVFETFFEFDHYFLFFRWLRWCFYKRLCSTVFSNPWTTFGGHQAYRFNFYLFLLYSETI